MIKLNHSMPLVSPDGTSLSNLKDIWQHGNDFFEYSRNKDGYRSSEFEKNPKFLFAGCSETFGESANYDTTWAYKLFNRLDKQESAYCNIGVPGIDVALVIYHILNFIDKYGKPENLFVIFPQLNRIIESTVHHVSSVTFTPQPDEEQLVVGNIKYSDEKTINCIKTSNVLQIKNLETLCKHLGINLYWGLWSLESHYKIIEEDMFDNYIDLVDEKEIADLILSNRHSDAKLTRSDGNHHGEIFHSHWSNKFYQAYCERV